MLVYSEECAVCSVKYLFTEYSVECVFYMKCWFTVDNAYYGVGSVKYAGLM